MYYIIELGRYRFYLGVDELEWLVKVYVVDIGPKNQLDLVVMLVDKDVARYVRYSSSGKDYGAHVVAIG